MQDAQPTDAQEPAAVVQKQVKADTLATQITVYVNQARTPT